MKIVSRSFKAVVASLFAGSLLLGSAATYAQSSEVPPQRVIVKWRIGAALETQGAARAAVDQALSEAHNSIGVTTSNVRTTANGAQVVKLDQRVAPAQLQSFIATLARNPAVEYVEEDRLMRRLLTPNDSRYNEQWHYFENNAGLRLPSAWDITIGAGVTVAVLDTGYRPHPDLAGNIVGGYDFISDTFVANDGNGRDSNAQDPGDWNTEGQCPPDPDAYPSSWHGTHVSGTVGALSNNSSGVAGVAFGSRVLPLRVLGRCGGYTSDIADAIIWASGGTVSGVPANTNVAKVVNLSLGGEAPCDSTTQNAINSARSRGTVMVVAAGNENMNAANSSPANCSGVITVASVNRSGGRAYYSNYGAVVDVAAPGGDIRSSASNGVLSTFNSGSTSPGSDIYGFYQGTSMAAPHVAGVVALMLSRNSALTPDEVESRLKTSTRPFPGTCNQCGTGIVDALAAVNAATGSGSDPDPSDSQLDNGVPVTNLSGSSSTELRFTMSVPAGATNLVIQTSGGTGDADLYVRFGSAPTTSTYDCRPYRNGNAESRTFSTPQSGTHHVMVRGYSSFAGVTLQGSYSTDGGSTACAAGFTEYTDTISRGGSAYLPSSSGIAAVSGTYSGRLSGPSGTDFDLSLQRRSGSSWSIVARSEGSSSTESIDYNGTASTYRWRVYAYSGSGTYRACVRTP